MENNFDKSIKKLLENYEEEFKPSDWDLMEQKIEEQTALSPEMEDVLLDGMAYDSLHDFNVPFNPEHWELMNERLSDPYALRRRLMKYKVAEVALVLLFIITIVQFIPFEKIQFKKKATNDPLHEVVDLPMISETPQAIQQLATLSESDADSKNDQKAVSASALNKQKTNSEFNKQQNEAPVIPNTVLTATSVDQNASSTPATFTEEAEAATDLSVINDKKEQKESESASQKASAITESFADLNTSLMSPILLKGANQLAISGVETLNNSKLFSDLKRPIKVRIGMAIGPDANYVMTPYDNRDRLEAFNQLALGYSGGLTLGFQYGNWEIETGAMYSAVSYDSRNVFQIKGSFVEGGYVKQGLAGAELDIVRIPLNVKYNFLKKKKWNFYAYTGASLNMAVEAFYNFTTRDVGQSDASRNFAAPSRAPGLYEEDEHIKAPDHAAYDGIFEGGTFSNNTFLTANLGFGVERYFTPRMSIFLQPGYQHQFTKGLGPQSDQFNSISILTGAKVTLKKKRKEDKRY